MNADRKKKNKEPVRWGRLLLAAGLLIGVILLTALVLSRIFPEDQDAMDYAPSYVDKQLLTKNPNSRPGNRLSYVKNIVIHYVANPGTSAQANRNYFENLQNKANNPEGVKASAHFIVGLNGEVVQCIPLTEIAYANYPRNDDTISIEVCHPDESGEFSAETYQAVVRLTADLLKDYGLNADDVIRHYDVSGKNCPKYYVEHEDAWQKLREDIRDELKTKE